jgi:hypothetical protein
MGNATLKMPSWTSTNVGAVDGAELIVGPALGDKLGESDGMLLGCIDRVGDGDGAIDGERLGRLDGDIDGALVGYGVVVGCREGTSLGV